MPESNCIDPRLGLVSFRYYEPLIATALANWPAETTFPCPDDRAPATFIARFRDTLCGYRIHHWPSELFTWELFASTDSKFALRLSEDRQSIQWSHKKAAGAPRKTTIGIASGHSASFGPFERLPFDQLSAFCTLINHNRLPGCQVLLLTPLPEGFDLTLYPNVEAIVNGSTTILF